MTKNTTRFLPVKGFRASGISSGIKRTGKKDLALIVSDVPATVAGVFTANRVKAAPVLLDMKRVTSGTSRGVIVNSGCANVSTGKRGLLHAERMTSFVEKGLCLDKGDMLVCSTGLIGGVLPIGKIERAAPSLIKGLSTSGWQSAASAIMTTDSYPKAWAKRVSIGGRAVTVLGVAKGAGMICPDMATMLAFFMTDAKISSGLLSRVLKGSVGRSFNRITVDGDTSTNDTVLAFANGKSGGRAVRPGTRDITALSRAFDEVSLKLAHLIVRDGEGATKFVEVVLKGAKSVAEAEHGARTLAHSQLVKTALFGEDPNWGRIIAALGRSGIRLNESKIDIWFNDVRVASRGKDAGNEKKAARALKKSDIVITVNLKVGKGGYNLWTTDLSTNYVRLNSAYSS